jgi:hypothetical protein
LESLEYEFRNVFSENFAEFTLGKVWKTRSELLVQGQNLKMGGGIPQYSHICRLMHFFLCY